MRIGCADLSDSDISIDVPEKIIYVQFNKGGRSTRPPSIQYKGYSIRGSNYESFPVDERLEQLKRENIEGVWFDKLYKATKKMKESRSKSYYNPEHFRSREGIKFFHEVANRTEYLEDGFAIQSGGRRGWQRKFLEKNRSGYEVKNIMNGLPSVEQDEWANWPTNKNRKSIFSRDEIDWVRSWPGDPKEKVRERVINRMKREKKKDSKFYVYVLVLRRDSAKYSFQKDSEKFYYVGQTTRPVKRIKKHLRKKNVRAVERVEYADNKESALERERELSFEIAIENNTKNILGGR